MAKTKKEQNDSARQSARMPKYRGDDLHLPIHAGHRILTGGELALNEANVSPVIPANLISKYLPKGYVWYLVKCAKPGLQYASLSTINLARAGDDGSLRLVLAATTMQRIMNYLENQPAWSVEPEPMIYLGW